MTIIIDALCKKMEEIAEELPPEKGDLRARVIDKLIPKLFPGYSAVLVRNGDEMVFVGKDSIKLEPLIVDKPPNGIAVSNALDVMRSVWQHVPKDKREDVAAVMTWLRDTFTRRDL